MSTLAPTAHSSTTAISKPAAAPRLDLYAPIHKALRLFMGDTLARVGRIDLSDSADSSATLQQLDALLELCRGHVAHENQHLHPALEARRPGASQRIGAEHDEHLDAIAALGADVAALRALPSAAAAHRLYRHLAVFIGENLVHMNVEETAHNATLWELCSDAELQDIHQRIMASVGPDELALVLRWMVPALSPAERAEMLGALQRDLPPEAMRGILDIVRRHLDDGAWAKLARALGLPPVPGLTA
jgi:hypothetical protein